mmetsp:Transcript_30794/g.73960  ORF Transcript_30794/g.73960 Transcript_30794/m.73960 type:complete len:91 (+) Transcript_30794:440-712(+)
MGLPGSAPRTDHVLFIISDTTNHVSLTLNSSWIQYSFPIERLIIASHRSPNLKNLLFPRHVESKCPSATPPSSILLALQHPQQEDLPDAT